MVEPKEGVTPVMKATLLGMLTALALAATAPEASAQTIVRAFFVFSLTDSQTGHVVYADRISSRSWTSAKACEKEAGKPAGFGFFGLDSAVDAVKSYGIRTKDGKPLTIAVESMRCIVIRE